MGMIDIKGVALEVQTLNPARIGQAPALVFLHEGLGSVALWSSKEGSWPQALCDALGCPGLVYSRLGYGQSDPIPDVRGAGRHGPDFMHRQAWEVLPELLAQLQIERPILIGHSDGGTIALLHASRHPVQACVVLAPHVRVEDISIASIQAAQEQYLKGDLRARLSRFHADVDVAFWQWCDVWLSQAFRSFDIRQQCRHIQAPVLALQGRQDVYGTLAQIEEIEPAGFIQRTVLEACGHSPHRDQRETVTQEIRSFLQQHVAALR
jgi:pimeloyl-ACP methyl ester carboxylesterase